MIRHGVVSARLWHESSELVVGFEARKLLVVCNFKKRHVLSPPSPLRQRYRILYVPHVDAHHRREISWTPFQRCRGKGFIHEGRKILESMHPQRRFVVWVNSTERKYREVVWHAHTFVRTHGHPRSISGQPPPTRNYTISATYYPDGKLWTIDCCSETREQVCCSTESDRARILLLQHRSTVTQQAEEQETRVVDMVRLVT